MFLASHVLSRVKNMSSLPSPWAGEKTDNGLPAWEVKVLQPFKGSSLLQHCLESINNYRMHRIYEALLKREECKRTQNM